MEKAIKILRDILAHRDVVCNLTDNQIQDSIKELEKIQDNMQVKILELKASHKQQIKEILKRLITLNKEYQSLVKYY